LGKFLGFMVSHRGIKINPDQIKAIQDLKASQTHKEIQQLTGITATLNPRGGFDTMLTLDTKGQTDRENKLYIKYSK
jgi:hypothetical protein